MNDTTFRTVLRGYEPSQVDQRVRDLTDALYAARHQADELARRVEALETAEATRRDEPEVEPKDPSPPSFAELGARVSQILSLAEEEAAEAKVRAEDQAAQHRRDVEESSAIVRAEADRYVTEARSRADTEAARVLEDARRRVDQIIDEADRDASARRGEAEAIHERQRAKSAQAAADFETTLAQRRQRAEKEFTERTSVTEHQLSAASERADAVRKEADTLHAEASTRAKRLVEEAEQTASHLVADAKTRADRIRSEYERELAAATARRDSINAQLTNVRQMLATLSGASPVAAEEPEADRPASPATDDAAGVPDVPDIEKVAAVQEAIEDVISETQEQPVVDPQKAHAQR